MQKEKKTYLKTSILLLVAFSSVFYSRILATTLNFSLLNLVHFALVPVVCIIALFTTRTKDKKQISLSLSFLGGLLILFGVSLASALLNGAGIINAIISFMMLGEPFMFLLAISCISLPANSLSSIRNFLYVSVLINFLLASIQKPLIDMELLNAGEFNGTDGCGGVFFLSGAGNYVSASVTIVFALYFWTNEKSNSKRLRFAVLGAAFWHILFSDSKQLVMAFGLAWLLFICLNTKYVIKTIRLLIGLTLAGLIGLWCVQNIEAFAAYTAWARPELYGSDGLAWYAKFYSIRLIIANFQSPLNYLLGLGPGHTVSRLGAWFLRDYQSMLGPLGATSTSLGQDSMDFVANFWLTSGSSLFSPIFGWAGIWGDLGFLGLGSYLYLGFLTWRHFCSNDILKIVLLSVLIIGLIFTQMEEPGYMISLAFILAISWHEERLEKRQSNIKGFISL